MQALWWYVSVWGRMSVPFNRTMICLKSEWAKLFTGRIRFPANRLVPSFFLSTMYTSIKLSFKSMKSSWGSIWKSTRLIPVLNGAYLHVSTWCHTDIRLGNTREVQTRIHHPLGSNVCHHVRHRRRLLLFLLFEVAFRTHWELIKFEWPGSIWPPLYILRLGF